MTPRTVRWIVLTTFAVGIAGMIVGSILDNNGVAITFGLITAVAALSLMLVTSVAGPGSFATPVRFDERSAAELEQRIGALVAAGADENDVRDLVRAAVRLGGAAARR